MLLCGCASDIVMDVGILQLLPNLLFVVFIEWAYMNGAAWRYAKRGKYFVWTSLNNCSVRSLQFGPGFLEHHNPYFAYVCFTKNWSVSLFKDWHIIIDNELLYYSYVLYN